MRLKQFIFALVAMLSLTFSVSAQTVSTAADLKNALSSTGAVVTLGDSITMTEVISIPQGISVTLDLNGKKITGNHSGYVFDITGSLTVKDSQGTGTVKGKSRVFTVKSKGSLTLNGGKFYKTSGQVIYTSGKLLVNGASVETKPGAALNVNTAAITGAGGTVELKAGTVTSVVAQFCDLKVSGTGVTVTDGINVYAGAKGAEITAGTIKGDVTIADEAKSKVTISGGSFEYNEAIKDCMADGSALLDKGDGTFEIVAGQFKVGENYYPTLAAAAEAAQAGNEIVMLADATVEGTLALPAGIKLTSNGHTINGSIRMLGNLELNGALTITGGLWVGKSGETLTATLSGDKLTASYFMFQHGTYTINADIDAVYGYLSYNGTFEVNSTIHTTGANGEVLYINGNVTLNDGAVLDSDNSVFVCNDNAVLTLKPGSKVDSNVSITKSGAKLNIDATGMAAGALANITGTVTNSGNGTIAVVGSDKLEAKIVDGKIVLNSIVAKIGDKNYATLEAAFAAATDGQTITMLDDATPALTSQRAITKAAVIDLNSKTMTLTEDDLYFGTTTFKNGTIVVDPSVKPSTAVFWMFANQTLTFDNVKIVATGVTGTYLIGLDGNNSDLNLLNGSEILVENTTALDLDIICVNASTGNDIKVENSKVNVTNLDGKVFFRGNYTVKDSEVNLAGITKAGFRIEAGQTLSIEGTSKVNIEGEPRDGGINLIGTASYTKAETATVNATVTETGFEAKIGDVKYTTFNEAVAAAQDGAEVTIHKAGTYNVPSGKNLTITGAVDGVQFGPIAEPNLGMKNYTFNNVTFNYANDSHYKGLQYAGEMEYNSCTFNGQVFLYGQKETFNKCTFYQTTNNYNVWTYSAKEVAFNECTFNSAGKSVLIYHESATVFNNVAIAKSTFKATQAVDGKAAIEMDASLTAGINLTIDAATTATGFGAGNVSGNSLWNNKKGNADEANNDITVVVAGVTVLAPVFDAKIGEKGYRNLQDAINAVKDGETVVLAQDFTGNITLTEKVGLHYTIDGAGKTMNGKITITPLSDESDNRRITIKGINFVNTADAAVDFISCAVTNHYPRLTVEGCTFTGNGKNTDVALRLKTAYGAVIKDCTGTGLHSFLQNTAGKNFTIEGVTVTESKGAFALGTVQGVTIKGSTIDVDTYGIRLDANTYNNNATIESNKVTAFIPVVVRKVNAESNVTFTGENTFTADNNDGKWMVIGTTEYEEGVALPAEVAEGNVVVALNGTNLSYEGVHGAGLAGKGTAEAPYLINNVAELEIFRNSVNAGSAKYSKPGLCIALGADIDMTGVNWVGIGTATADHGFMGNFDGKNFKIKNLTITNPALDSDGYAYAGLFGVTEGTDKDNQNTIKNLTIENVTINTTGDIVSAAIAYPYYTNVDNVKVCGDIKIQGGKYTAGVLAYTRRCVNASNLSIVGNAGSYVKGTQTVGGVISDIQMNGGLTAVYSNFSAEGITVTGEKSVGGIAGIIATQTLNGATVKNVTLSSQDAFAGVVAGRLGGTSTISNVVSENVTGATAVIGATFDGAKAVEARIGDTYYSTFAGAYTAAKAGETVTMLTDLNMSEILVLDKAITLDGNGKKLTSTAGRAINVDCEGNVGIKNLTINASGERAINVIQKPATVTIENVTATAANYTVNLASSAGAAKVAISNSNLTGLNVVNVAAPGSEITINGGTIVCNDQTDAESYAALVLNKDAESAKIVADGVTFDIKGDSRKATNQAKGGTITIDDSTKDVEQHVAYISYGNNWYGFATLEAAIAKANAGETVTLLRDINASAIITINKSITLDGNGKTLTSTAGRAINVETEGEVTISNLTINAAERAINIINKPATVTLNAVTATANNNAVMIATSAGAAKVTINGCNFTGLAVVNVAGANAEVAIKDTKITNVDNTDKENYGAITVYSTATNANVTVEGGSITVAYDSKKAYIFAEGATVTGVDQVGQIVAMIGDAGYETLEEAISGAKAGQTVKLVCNITVANPVTIAKSITLDGANKTLTYTGTDRAIEMPNVADADYDVTIKNLNVVATTANRGLNYNDNGKLNVEGVTVTIGENVDGYAINFPGMADNAQVTINDSKLTSRNPLNIWGENMTINVHNSEITSVDNSTTFDYAAIQLNNDNYGNVANGTVVNVYGGTITALNEKGEPSNVVANATETGVVNISDETDITGKVLNYVANIGGAYFGSLQAAVNAIEKHGYNSPIVIMKNFAAEVTTIKSGLKVTINLNGKTITGTDNGTASYGLININPGAELTINGNGAITLTATQDRDWNAYSSVISNQRGKLTVNGGTIEHLGGTAMAYAIDNLTNGKGTYAETIINGGTIKSTYRAIRQFLNGTEAQNILTVNGGTIEGTNKSIWMQEASANANNGALTVAADAAIKGDVYLSANASAKEWPVTVAVAAAALQGESKVLTSNVPAGYDLANVDGIYGIYSGAAKIGTTYYATIDEAIKAAKAGETVNILAGTYKVPSMKAGITVEGAVNADGTPAVLLEGTLSNTLENLTLKNLHIKGGNAQRWAYAKGNLVFENVIFEATSVYALHFDGIAAGTNLTYKNCTIIGWAALGGTPESCVFEGCTIKGNGNYGVIRTYFETTIKDCTFDVANVNTNDAYQDGIHAVDADVVVDICTNVNGDMKDLVNINGASKVTVDGVVYKNVAKVGDKNYITIEDAFAAWADGTTLTLLTDIALDTKTLATQNDGYAVLVNVNGKKVTLDLNGKKITVNAAAADLASAKGGMLLGVFSADLNGHLTLTDNSDAKNGAVTLNVNDAKVYGMFVSESGQSDKSNSGKITVNGGNYTTVGKVANAMFFTDANEVITVNGGNFHCDQVSNTANYPWMFNTVGNNERHVTVNGGTFNIDVNHQHRPFEVKVPETLAVKANGDGTWTVVEAEAYITEMLGGTVNEAGEWGHEVGYATIAEAIAAVKDGQTITLVKNITYTKDKASVNGEYVDGLVYTGDKSFTIDFNGKTITENGDINDYLVYLKNAGEKDNEITFKNGTIAINGESSNTAWAALTVGANSATHKTTLNLNGMKVVNGNPNDASNQVIRVRKGSVVNLNEGTVVTSNGTSYGVVAETTATVNINNGAKVVHTNSKTSGGNQVYTAVSGNGTINVYDGAEIVSDNYGIHNMTTGNAVINIYGGTIEAKVAVKASTNGGAGESATVTIEGGNFKGALENYTDAATIVVKGGTFDALVDTKYVATGFICKDNGDGTFGVIVDPKHGKVAQIIRNDYYAENQYFATINEAVQAAQSGETVTLIADVETSAAGYATIGEEGYAAIVAVKEKDITLNLNGKSVTVNPTAEELAGAKSQMLMSVFGMDTNGKLTLTGNGSVKVNANGANVYSLIAAYGEGSEVVIENGNYEADAVMSSGSLIYSHEMVTVMGGTYKLGNIATGANGSPWIFNTVGQNYTGVKVVGGTFPTDINHQFWANEVLVPEAYALKDNGDGTWTVVDAVAYTNEKATSRNASWRHVGYASLEDAIAATGKYNCQDNTVTMIKDIALEPITIANGVEVALDLNGKTISGTDNGTASYGLITNKGDLTINGTGAITLTATQNRGWSAFSSVISNQVGGKLTVNGGTIEHLGGTSMAWGIDNLTNGKGTYAETEINGGVVKSKYIAIRQFLNGVEADNILTVNGGTLEGETASLYFQDPSKNANTGTLNVLDGTLAGDVYLDVTEGSTEWPVEVYIAKDALGQNEIHADNVPAEAAALVEYDTFWQVEQKNLAELTIKDACAEYINKIEKNVGVLTYEREFAGTEWQTIVLPFDVPVANLMDEFEIAYIYNAIYKDKAATIDYVEIKDAEFVLAANYPYLIKAKEAGYKSIVVENAKLMPTEVKTIDCSSVFETFSFIGSYATVETEKLDATKGYFNLISGAWSKLGTVNPFRFYMQIEKRNGNVNAFEYPEDTNDAKAIRMRQVDADGEATGIDSVGAVTEQNSGLIFDLHGRRVVEPKKGGLYIVNGKKVVF